jgi:hypothetical protein
MTIFSHTGVHAVEKVISIYKTFFAIASAGRFPGGPASAPAEK